MSAKDFVMNIETSLNINIENLTDYTELVYRDIFSNVKYDLINNYKMILIVKLRDNLYYFMDYSEINDEDKVLWFKAFHLLYYAIKYSTNSFCSMLCKLAIYMCNVDDTIVDNVEEWIYDTNFNNWKQFIVTIIGLNSTIKLHKELNKEFIFNIHKKIMRKINKEFLELVMHPDNLRWMRDCQLIETKW